MVKGHVTEIIYKILQKKIGGRTDKASEAKS